MAVKQSQTRDSPSAQKPLKFRSQALSQACAFPSQKLASMSVMAIFRQPSRLQNESVSTHRLARLSSLPIHQRTRSDHEMGLCRNLDPEFVSTEGLRAGEC